MPSDRYFSEDALHYAIPIIDKDALIWVYIVSAVEHLYNNFTPGFV